ncbi:MAG TPA: ATP-binding cassette domain-containing protein [Gaiellaceae bacterium]
MSRDAVAFHGVSRVYRSAAGSVEALHAADAVFAEGSIAALVGPSGSGKSTLLRILGGIDAADAGSITVAATDVRALAGGALRRYRRETVAYLAQRGAANLVPHLTLREQLGPGGEEIVDAVGLGGRVNGRADELSGGEQARAALAVGLSRQTPVVLLDEPTAELDRGAATLVLDLLRDAAAHGRTVVVATHDPELVAVADATLELSTPAQTAAPDERPRVLGETEIRIDGVSKSYSGTRVVDAATLDVRSGELAVLLGRSGSGKSTLLMVAGGWTPADSGELQTPGTAWESTAYLAQRFGLLPELTVAENVALPFRGSGRDERERVPEMLERLGLGGLEERLPAETSIGQQQRTALARALVVQPKALLADEPTSHQDAGSAARVWDALAAACAEGTACLVATHDEAATRHADRTFRIDSGRIAG